VSSFILYIYGGKYISSVLSTEDAGLIALLERLLPEHGYEVKVKQLSRLKGESGPEHQ
jgi:hypothetical protein